MADPAAPAVHEFVDVVGVAVPIDTALPEVPRPHVVIVVDGWGSSWGERLAATRFVAGALALSAHVTIVSLEDRSDPAACNPPLRYDGVFPVHSVAAPVGAPTDARTDLLRTALLRQPGAVMPEAAADGWLRRVSRPSTEAVRAVERLKPDVVVLAGLATFWLGTALPTGAAQSRVVVLPLCGDDPALASSGFKQVAGLAHAIGAVSRSERDVISSTLGADCEPRLSLLDIAFPVNSLAAKASMAGVGTFGRYVLVISAFDEDPAIAQCPPHDYLRLTFGDVAIAEVRRASWLVTGEGRRFDIPWRPSRMDLWRLMSRAELTVDLRPPGPLGREAVESLRFGTPVVVPAGSVAAEKAALSNGGLWYRNQAEMISCVRRLLDDGPLRAALGASGRDWAAATHGDTDTFVEQVLAVVLDRTGPA